MKKYLIIISTFILISLYFPIQTFADSGLFGYICTSENVGCSADMAIYKIYKESEDTYRVCSMETTFCNYSNTIFIVERNDQNSFYVCKRNYSACNVISGEYFMERDSEDSYYMCKGNYPICNLANGDYFIEKDSNDTYDICEGNYPICNIANYKYVFKKDLTYINSNEIKTYNPTPTVISKSKPNLTKIEPKIKKEIKTPAVVKVEPKEESTPQITPAPILKLHWYQKIFNWLFK